MNAAPTTPPLPMTPSAAVIGSSARLGHYICDMETEKQNAQHALPLGAVVIYKDESKTAKLVVVQHSRDCDQTPLYMVGEKPIAPPDDKYKLCSMGYLTYRLHVGCFAGNVPLSMLTDTGERVPLERFDVERYDSWPNTEVRHGGPDDSK